VITLQDKEILQEIKNLQGSVDWEELAPLNTIHKVKCTKKAGRAAVYSASSYKHLKIDLEKPDNRDLYCKIVL
jgi:hypothetical protein